MRLAHNTYLDTKKTLKELTRLFVWTGVTMDVKAHVNSCGKCSKHNKRGHWKTPMCKQPIFSQPFECISPDIVGPFRPGSGRKMFILTHNLQSVRVD